MSIVKKIFWIRIILINMYFSFINKLKMRIWGIKYGKNVQFIGKTIFYKETNSSIIIGNNCIFNSSSLYNFRGINHPCILQTGDNNAKIVIGNNCGLSGVSITCNKNIIIGDNTIIGANSKISDRNGHENKFNLPIKSVIIGKNVWIGMDVIIMPGVTIGDNSIIGAGSIVTKNIPSNVIAVGNPCKVIKER